MDNQQPIIIHTQPEKRIYQIAFMEKPYQLFSYSSTQLLNKGTIVEVPFGKTKRVGCVWDASEKSWDGPIKNVSSIIQPSFWSAADMIFIDFCQKYYHAPLQEVLQAALPSVLRKAPPASRQKSSQDGFFSELMAQNSSAALNKDSTHLNMAQKQVVDSLRLGAFYRFYLYGITGSGKTRCYIEWIRRALLDGNVLLMIPEIHLSHQMLAVLQRYLDAPVLCYHSQLTPKKRREVFSLAASGHTGIVFLTTRSGVFLPIRSLSLIIVDEEHDSSYKQQEGSFRYHARDLALKKAQIMSCACVLGSATPSAKFVELLNEQQETPSGWGRGFLKERATGYPLPKIELVMVPVPTHQEPLDFSLLQQMRDCLNAQQHVLIYLNQRGYAPKLFCPGCRKTATCPSCLTSLTQHQDENESFWVCHHCSRHFSPKSQCYDCQSPYVILGFGTQRLSEYLQEIFPKTPVIVLDTDHLKNTAQVQECFEALKKYDSAILIGTQMISKGHDWDKLSLVIVLIAAYQLKQQLNIHIAQQIMQTAGRSGRHQQGRVLLPMPHQESIDKPLETLVQQDYLAFMHTTEQSQHQARQYQAKFLFQTRSLESLMSALRPLCLRYHLLGPCLDYPYRRGALWRVYALLTCASYQSRASDLKKILYDIQSNDLLEKNFLSVEIDPLDI